MNRRDLCSAIAACVSAPFVRKRRDEKDAASELHSVEGLPPYPPCHVVGWISQHLWVMPVSCSWLHKRSHLRTVDALWELCDAANAEGRVPYWRRNVLIPRPWMHLLRERVDETVQFTWAPERPTALYPNWDDGDIYRMTADGYTSPDGRLWYAMLGIPEDMHEYGRRLYLYRPPAAHNQRP